MNPIARSSDLIIQDTKDETLVYNTSTNKAMSLNRTISIIWKNCDGSKSIEQIKSLLETELKAKIDNDLILLALAQLKENDLILGDDREFGFEKTSRRELIRKAGLTAMVSLPLIAVVTAPRAANAQSIDCGGGAFNNNCVCDPGTPVGASCGIGGSTAAPGVPACNPGCLCTVGAISFGASLGMCAPAPVP